MSDPDRSLDTRLLAAHQRDDVSALVSLYTEAGDRREEEGDVDAACFYLTHAYVYALQLGDTAADRLQARLSGYGREAPPAHAPASDGTDPK